MINLVNTDQARSQFKHVIPQRNDDELSVLGAFFDVTRHDGDLPAISAFTKKKGKPIRVFGISNDRKSVVWFTV